MKITFEKSKSGIETMLIEKNGKKGYIHSKYNPIDEAEKLISGVNRQIENSDMVIFWGMGLGYHIDVFIKFYSDKDYIIIEPQHNVFKAIVSRKGLENTVTDRLKATIFLDSTDNVDELIERNIGSSISPMFIILPSYEKSFQDQYKKFYSDYGHYMQDYSLKSRTRKAFQKIWTKNVMQNFSEIISTTDIFNLERSAFRNKPAIIVSAGPSLDYEIENLKIIKKNGLAYIFSAGSAISTLVENNVFPDAAWSIDPGETNFEVFKKVKDNSIIDIPLVFATTVGYNTAQMYQGSKLHFITNKDTISSCLIRYSDNKELTTVEDASSVAVVILEVLIKLEFNPIIFVGQNLAFENNQYYSDGVDYGMFGEVGSGIKYDLDNTFKVKAAEGGYVNTTASLNNFRLDFEEVINKHKNVEIINTTKSGAEILGTYFIQLKTLIEERLKGITVDPDWYKNSTSNIDIKYLQDMYNNFNQEYCALKEMIKKLKDTYTFNNSSENWCFNDDFEVCKKVINNNYFKAFVYPMNFYNSENIVNEVRLSKKNNNQQESIYKLAKFLIDCENDMITSYELFNKIGKEIVQV